ncbi:MAG TPA: hypothetical protein VME45_02775 [Stellaceae bacterium]|nr:hypothetical protein [Stellaceae bacterium]
MVRLPESQSAANLTIRRIAMDLNRLYVLIEKLQRQTIGEPKWDSEKEVFEYDRRSADVVAVLKAVRAAHGISALDILCNSGLFIDFGVIIRCINDCNTEIFFLLENYPNLSRDVERFVDAFFHATIDEDLSQRPPAIQARKIRSAMVRVLKGQHDDALVKLTERIYGTFSGYVHANYAHIMEVYNGATKDFNLRGVPSHHQQQIRQELLNEIAVSVLHSITFIANTLGLIELRQEIAKLL